MMDTAAKRQCTPFVPELNSSFDPMSAQKTHYMAELLSSQTTSEQLSAQACAQEAIVKAVQSAEQKSAEPAQGTFLSKHGLFSVSTSPSESPFPVVAPIAKQADRQKPSNKRPPVTLGLEVRAPTDPSTCTLPSITQQDKTKEVTVHLTKRSETAKAIESPTKSTPTKAIESPTKSTPTKTIATSSQPAATPTKNIATPTKANISTQPKSIASASLGVAPTHVIPEAIPHPAYNYSPGRMGTSPTKKREHSAISQSTPSNIILMDSSDSETDSDYDLQDDTPTTSSLEATSSSLGNTPITISIPKNLLQDDIPETPSSLEATSSSFENTPITISIPKNLFQSETPTTSREGLQCEYMPARFLSHQKSFNEEFLVGMTPLQLLHLKNIRNFIRDLIGATFDYSFDKQSCERLSVCRYQYNKDNRIPFLVKSTTCNCNVCQRNVSTKGCYSDVRISFLLPSLVVSKWSAKEVENNWLSGDKSQEMPRIFSNTYFQPYHTYTIGNLNVTSFDICLFAKSSSRLGTGAFETSDDLFTAISNYLMTLIKPYLQTTVDARPNFEEWVANNPHIIIQKDDQDPLDS